MAKTMRRPRDSGLASNDSALRGAGLGGRGPRATDLALLDGGKQRVTSGECGVSAPGRPLSKCGHVSEGGIRRHPGRAGTGARPYMANPNVTVCKTHYFIPARKLEALGLVGSWPRRLLVRGQRRAKTVVILAVVEG